MNLVRHTLSALLMTVVTTVLLGVVYPLVVTALAQTIFPDQATASSSCAMATRSDRS